MFSVYRRLYAPLSRGIHTFVQTVTKSPAPLPEGFKLFPEFLSLTEQRTLLSAALSKLDSTETKQARKRRRDFVANHPRESRAIEDVFLPDAYYNFEEGHYDGVIRHYREMHLSSWPEDQNPGLSLILTRLQGLYPTSNVQTHLLHLSSRGEILGHVDNIEASGTWILGVSLGAARVLRMESTNDPEDSFEVLLQSGCVYIQRDSVRYDYNHSILRGGRFRGGEIKGGQRVSMMVRVS
ncbi:hypothetical protein K503DRAFT_690714 [Rhizopogon vinicolor AM-OR11-026]|uniref:Alpha-ketoglutarate-dependent dioxygenase AlkB-like domain-containing protein n=1 Tax=Rhizopogon vinicolor AM-OR11-026 TaxID=1314800 RepID=A0A1B7N221_9AGAM|nr:hypothetical protein K503DRAFT_690714 [Rhizopogon vinicolor AM-OR11-026]